MSRSPSDYLRHILDEVDYLVSESDGLTNDDFLASETLKRAFVRSIEIIGEATKRLPSEITAGHSEIDWKSVAGMRDRLIHAYFGIDYEIVWDVVTHKIPELREVITKILGELDTSP